MAQQSCGLLRQCQQKVSRLALEVSPWPEQFGLFLHPTSPRLKRDPESVRYIDLQKCQRKTCECAKCKRKVCRCDMCKRARVQRINYSTLAPGLMILVSILQLISKHDFLQLEIHTTTCFPGHLGSDNWPGRSKYPSTIDLDLVMPDNQNVYCYNEVASCILPVDRAAGRMESLVGFSIRS